MTDSAYITNEATAASRAAAWLSFSMAALFLALLAVLPFIASEFDPSWRMISEYEIGRYGWVMQAAFLAQALSGVALIVTVLPQVRTRGGRIGFALLFVTAIGLLIAAFNVTGPIAVPYE
jgi:hypothetical protein